MKSYKEFWNIAIFILLANCSFSINNSRPTDDEHPLFQVKEVNKIEFWFNDDSLWYKMATDYRSKNKNYFKVRCLINGQEFETTGIRFKGQHSYSFAWTDKKPLKVKLNEFDENEYLGVSKFNLANAFEDPSFQRDVQSLRIMRQMCVPAPRTSYAKVFLNGNYFGLYILIEQLNDAFLKSNFGEDSGPLFESNGFCLGIGTIKELELKENKNNYNRRELIEFADLFRDTNDPNFHSEIEKRFNVETFIKACAVDVYLGNKDSYAWGRCHNFYLYFRQNGIVEWIAWDYNLSFGYEGDNERFYPFILDRNIFLRKLLENEKYLTMYWQAIDDVSQLTTSFSFKRNVKRINRILKPSVEADPNKFYSADTFNISLNESILGGLSTQIVGLLQYTKTQRRKWKAFKKEENIFID